jgi:hypothetical protein
LWRNEIHVGLKIEADASVVFVSGEQYIISIKESDGTVLASAHAFVTYAI